MFPVQNSKYVCYLYDFSGNSGVNEVEVRIGLMTIGKFVPYFYCLTNHIWINFRVKLGENVRLLVRETMSRGETPGQTMIFLPNYSMNASFHYVNIIDRMYTKENEAMMNECYSVLSHLEGSAASG